MRVQREGRVVLLVLAALVALAGGVWFGGSRASAEPLDVLRLNVGGPGYTDSQGNLWAADAGTVCGNPQKLSTTQPIADTADPALYQDGRYAATLSCSLDVPDSYYLVEIKLAEIYHTEAAKRMLDVFIEDALLTHNLDVVVAAGGAYTAHDIVYYVDITDGTLNLRLVAVKDSALLNALRITRVDAPPSPTQTGTPTPTVTRTATVTPTPTFVGEQRTTFQRGAFPSAGYTGADDVTIVEAYPTQTHGDQSNLYLRPILNYPGMEEEALMRFELDPYIPNNAVVGQAILSMYVYSATNIQTADLQVFAMSRPWVPASATWLDAYALNPWQQPGAYGQGDRAQSPILVRRMPSCPVPWSCEQWLDLDVTSLVQQWVATPTSNNGVLLRLTNQGGSVEYVIRSSDYWLTTTVRPKLSVIWAAPTPGPTRTSTATPADTATPTGTATATPANTATATVTPTEAPSKTPTGTATGAPTATRTATTTGTSAPSATPSRTPTATRTATITSTPLPSATGTATLSPTPSGTPTTCSDVYEPDNSAAQARAIEINGEPHPHSNARPNDQDWVKFPVLPGYIYSVRTLGLLGPNNDTVLDLFDTDGTTALAHNDDDAIDGGPASRIDWQFEAPGTYYARVMQLRADEVAGCEIIYYLQVLRQPVPPTPTPTATPTTPPWRPIFLPLIVAG